MQDRSRRLFDPAVLFSTIVAVLGILQAWQYSNQGVGFDFYQFWVVGTELRAGHDANIYTDSWRQSVGERYYAIGHEPDAPARMRAVSEARRLLQTFSSPLLYTFVSLIGVASYTASLTIFKIIAIGAGIVAIFVLCQLLDYSIAASILVVGVMLGWGQPFLSDLFVGNVNGLQLLMIAGLLWVELRMRVGASRDFSGGAILALMALFKPNLSTVAVLLGVMWMVDRQWVVLARHVAGGIAASVVLVLVSSWRFGGLHCWFDWLGALHQLGVEERTIAGSNCALVQVLREFAGTSIATVSGAIIGIAALVMVAISRGKPRVFVTIAVGAALPLLTAPVAWLHYFVFCTPLLLLMASRIEVDPEKSLNGIVRYVVAGGCFITMSIAPIFSTDDLESTAIRMVIVAMVLLVFGVMQLLSSATRVPV